MYASDYDVPNEIRAFGWSMLVVHLQKLNFLIDRAQEAGASHNRLQMARKYLQALAGDGPDDPEFVQWCREALECTDFVVGEAKKPLLEVIDGGRGDGE